MLSTLSKLYQYINQKLTSKKELDLDIYYEIKEHKKFLNDALTPTINTNSPYFIV